MSKTVQINAQPLSVALEASLADCIRQHLKAEPQAPLAELGVALAVNGQVVPQQAWPEYQLNEGDQIALFRAIAGG